MRDPYRFDPARHREALAALLPALATDPELTPAARDRLLARHPKDGRGFFSKSELLAGLRWLRRREPASLADLEKADLDRLAARLRGKPVRSLSGVAVVTVFTRPHPCPGRCVFCPSDVRMPKSYLSDEPGCQRAAANRFDPFAQTWSRLRALTNNGHPVDKVELLVLGGTWSSYPEAYQVEFLARCFEALNQAGERLKGGELTNGGGEADGRPLQRLERASASRAEGVGGDDAGAPWEDVDGARWEGCRGGEGGAAGEDRLDGRRLVGGRTAEGESYNRRVGRGAERPAERPAEAATGLAAPWLRLETAQRANETAGCRCVGLALETRPDRIDGAEVRRLRRQGATKVQIGLQSLSDDVLAANRRGHDVAASRQAVRLLRGAGFKVQAHWMANLLGSSPEADVADARRLFTDPGFRPDELKVYPCSLVDSAELMRFWEAGEWSPYDAGELLSVVTGVLAATPRWCRLSRVVRDIPGTDVVAGSRVTNLRQVAEAELARRGQPVRDVRAREVRGLEVEPRRLELRRTAYSTSSGEERFLELVTADDRLAGFLRLSLPAPEALDGSAPEVAAELAGRALIREVHVYGRVAGFGAAGEAGPAAGPGRAARGPATQHRGLGSRLVEEAIDLAAAAGYPALAVISAVGTRAWYRRLGFADGGLYQHRTLSAEARSAATRR